MKLADLMNPDYTHFSTQISKRIRVNKNNTTVTVVTSYISIKKYVILETLPCGSYKVRIETERNYSPKDVFTTYFNSVGRELNRNEYKGIKLTYLKERNELIKNGYSFNMEFCGHPDPRIVVRYLDKWVSQHTNELEAIEQAKIHYQTIKSQFAGMHNFINGIKSKYKKP